MVFDCADLTLSIFLYITVRSPTWPYNYRFRNSSQIGFHKLRTKLNLCLRVKSTNIFMSSR